MSNEYNFNEHIMKTLPFNIYKGSEKKRTIILDDNCQYMLKFPDPTREENREISYINNAVSEYIGCKIFEQAGFQVQSTILGEFSEKGKTKVACACKDIRSKGEVLHEMDTICLSFLDTTQPLTFDFIRESLEGLEGVDADSIFTEYCNRFIIDAFIGNTDRHNGNWGIIEEEGKPSRIAPVYDCESCLSPLYADDELSDNLAQREALNVYSVIRNDDGNRLNYKDFLLSGTNDSINRALQEVVPKIDLKQIHKIIDDIPYISDVRKEFYKTMLNERYDKILIPALENVLSIQKSQEYKEWNSKVIGSIYDKYIDVLSAKPKSGTVEYGFQNNSASDEFISLDYQKNNNVAFFMEGESCMGMARLEKSNLNVCKFVQSARKMGIPVDTDISFWKEEGRKAEKNKHKTTQHKQEDYNDD